VHLTPLRGGWLGSYSQPTTWAVFDVRIVSFRIFAIVPVTGYRFGSLRRLLLYISGRARR